MSIFPGIRINDNKNETKLSILNGLNPNNIAPIDNMKSWIRIDEGVYELGIFEKYEEFYLLYKHPVHEYMDKLFDVSRDDLVQFMKNRINSKRCEGIDIIVCSKDFSSLIVCNHDGEIYKV